MVQLIVSNREQMLDAIRLLDKNDPQLTDLVIKDKFANFYTVGLISVLNKNTHLRSITIGSDCFTSFLQEQVFQVFIKSLHLNELLINKCQTRFFKQLCPSVPNEIKEEFEKYSIGYARNLRAYYAFCTVNNRNIEKTEYAAEPNSKKRKRVTYSLRIPDDVLRNIFEYAVYFKPKSFRVKPGLGV